MNKNKIGLTHNIINETNLYDIGDIVNVVEYDVYNGVICSIEYYWSRKQIIYTIRYWDMVQQDCYEITVNEDEIEYVDEYVGMGAYL